VKPKCNKHHLLIIPVTILIVSLACSLPSFTEIFDREDIESVIDEATSRIEEAVSSNEDAVPSSAPISPETTLHLTPIEGIACTHYVAPTGSNDHPGTEDQPWGTFEHAAEIAQPGDTVCFRDGNYPTDDTHLFISGKPDAWITFSAYPGEHPVLDGRGTANELLIFQANTAYIRVSGFTIQNFRIWGIFLTGNNHHIYLDHLEVIDGEAGIHFTYGESSEGPPAEGPVEYITLEDSVIHGSEYVAVDCTPGPCNYMTVSRVEIYGAGIIGESFYGADGLEFARGHHVIVEDSYVHDNGGDGIDLGSRDRDGHMLGIIVRRNVVARNRCNGIKVWAGGRIENNAIWGSGDSAIWAGTWHSAVEIINNTVAYNMWDPSYALRNWAVVVGYPEELPKPEVNLVMVNNIFAFNADSIEGGSTGVYLGAGVQLTEGHNLYFSSSDGEITAYSSNGQEHWLSRGQIADGTWTALLAQGDGNLVLDPLFVSGWPDVDLHLQPGSPAINAGTANFSPDVDMLSNPRDSQPDIGAYEN
jgi:hypothetical protein